MVHTDVRSCGLLISDLSKDGTFKFAHKSYMELLQAQAFDQSMSPDSTERIGGQSLVNTFKLHISDIQHSIEAISFFAEQLKIRLYKQGITDDLTITKALRDILVVGKFTSQSKVISLLIDKWISGASCMVDAFAPYMNRTNKYLILLILITTALIPTFIVIQSIDPPATPLTIFNPLTIMLIGTFVMPFSALPMVWVTNGQHNKINSHGLDASDIFVIILICSFILNSIYELLSYPGFLKNFLIILVAYAVPTFLFSLVVGLACDFIHFRKRIFFKRLCLWYQTCSNLQLSEAAIIKTVGFGMVILIVKDHYSKAEIRKI